MLAGAILFQIVYVNRRLQIDHWFCFFFGAELLVTIMVVFNIQAIWPRLRKGLIILFVVTMVTASISTGTSLSQHWHDGFQSHYDKVFPVGNLSGPRSNSLEPLTICVLENRYYPFFGSRRQNRVCQPLYAPSSLWLMDYFYRERICFVVWRVHPSGTAMRRFFGINDLIVLYANRFRLSYRDTVFLAYKFLRL